MNHHDVKKGARPGRITSKQMPGFTYSNVEKEMAVYGYDTVVKSHCRMCHGGCGVLVYLKNGRIAKIADTAAATAR